MGIDWIEVKGIAELAMLVEWSCGCDRWNVLFALSLQEECECVEFVGLFWEFEPQQDVVLLKRVVAVYGEDGIVDELGIWEWTCVVIAERICVGIEVHETISCYFDLQYVLL